MQVKDLTIEEFKLLIQETVAETIQTLLNDPDEGKKIKLEVKQQLLDSLHRTQAGERGISAEEVAKKLGLNW
jgi:RNA 3'-terminal phosphate cyclase